MYINDIFMNNLVDHLTEDDLLTSCFIQHATHKDKQDSREHKDRNNATRHLDDTH